MKKVLFAVAILLSAGMVYAGEHPTEPYTGSPAFEKIKSLEGQWKGTALENGVESPVEVNYEVSSGGSAVVEKLFAGTPNEMVSIYNDEKGELVMTHYCMMQNQPKLKLVSADDKQIQLEFTPANSVSLEDSHMHSLTMTFDGPNEMTHVWSGYKDGKPISGEPTVLHFQRVETKEVA